MAEARTPDPCDDGGFRRGEVPRGDNQGLPYAVPQPVAGRYAVGRFFASRGRHLLLDGRDQKTGALVLIKCVVRHDVEPWARAGDREGFANQLRATRKALEAEHRLLVRLAHAGCTALPLPLDLVFDANPQLGGPYPTDDLDEWRFDDAELLAGEPYLILKATAGTPLDEAVEREPGGTFTEGRALRVVAQLAAVLRLVHRPLTVRTGLTWQVVLQSLGPANVLLAGHDRVALPHLDGCQLTNAVTGVKLLAGTRTPGYSAPEGKRPRTTLTPAADVYSLGAVLAFLLTGRPPGEGLPGCRPATRRFLGRCLAPDPADRYPDADAVLEALEQVTRAA